MTAASTSSAVPATLHKLQNHKQETHYSSQPHLKITTSSGSLRSLLLMKRSKCFWCMQALQGCTGRQRRQTRYLQGVKRSSHKPFPLNLHHHSPHTTRNTQTKGKDPHLTCGAHACQPCARCRSLGVGRSSAPKTPCLQLNRNRGQAQAGGEAIEAQL